MCRGVGRGVCGLRGWSAGGWQGGGEAQVKLETWDQARRGRALSTIGSGDPRLCGFTALASEVLTCGTGTRIGSPSWSFPDDSRNQGLKTLSTK